MGNPVIPVVGVAASVAIEPIPHVHELFDNHELHRPWLLLIDSFEVDEYGVIACPVKETVGSAVC